MDKGSQLFDAATRFNWPLVRQLIGPETTNYYNKDEEWDNSILDILIMSQRTEEIQMLIQAKADVNSHSWGKFTPLHRACTGSCVEIFPLLINAGANVNACDQDGDTPLIWAADYAWEEVIQLLLSAGADLFLQNSKGETAKKIALRLNKREGKITNLLDRYEQQWIHCKSAQIAFCRIFKKHQRAVLVPDMVKLIADLIWKTRMLHEWNN